MAFSTLAPLAATASPLTGGTPKNKEQKVRVESEAQDKVEIPTYQTTERDFALQATDSIKPKPAVEDNAPTILGYDLDTRFARVSASPRLKDGGLMTKVKAKAVRLSATKDWQTEDGTSVRRGFSSRVNYEGEATLNKENGFDFQSKHVDLELGVEQRYDKVIDDGVNFSHRYFVGGRYRYRFGQTEGSEFRAIAQTEQKMYKRDAWQIMGTDFGWEARAVQTFETNWGRVNGDGPQANFEIQGLLTKDLKIKLLGKKRDIKLKAGPEIKYSTQGAWSIGPEVGVKVRL